jgi:hypothetical protein
MYAAQSYLIDGTTGVIALVQQLIIAQARMNLIAGDHIRSAALIGSISALTRDGQGTTEPNLIHMDGNNMWAMVGAGGSVEFGPEAGNTADPQSWLLEFGFRHYQSGAFIHYPYLIPARDMMEKPFIDMMVKVMRGVAGFPQDLPSEITKSISNARSFLYSTSRALGDVQVFSGSSFMSGTRSSALVAARGLGDANALMRGGLASIARISLRLAGRGLTGSFRSSVNIGSTYGNASNRIYNRLAGRGFGIGLRQFRLGA